MVDRKQVLKAAIEAKADVYHANNWEALPVAAEAAKQNNAKLFLDIHESTKVSKGWLYELLNKIVVRRYSDEIDACSTVVDPIAKNYQQMFGLKPIIIRNIPELPATDIKFHLVDPEKIRLIHHGVAMPGRSPELMIRTLSKSKKNYELHLVFTNYSSKYVNSLQKLANEIAPKRVFFYPPYPIHEILTEISKYDIGFFPLPPNVYNYLIALPNKLFEFIAAGLAVCIGPSPSMAQVVRKYNCGIVAPTFNPEDLAQILNHTPVDKWNDMKKASLIASKELNADNEIEKLVKIYNQIINWN
jgi:glycosyltransferase involved in cell wall biosynthesis